MIIRLVSRADVSHALREYTIDNVDVTLADFLAQKLYKYGVDLSSVSVIADGVTLPRDVWSAYRLTSTKRLVFVIEPQGTAFLVASIVIAIAAAVYTYITMRKLQTKGTDKGRNSSSIYDVNAQGNQVKLEDPIPEQFGLVKAFPDYASDKHFYYINNVRYMDVLLCQGVGYYNATLDTMYIGATALSTYASSDIDVLIAEPGESIASHNAHRCWFNSTEIDAAGKEVPARDYTARGRGERQSTDITFVSDTDIQLTTVAPFYANDIIQIYNLPGTDYAVQTTGDVEYVLDCTRVYVTEYPADDMSLAIGKRATLAITSSAGSHSVPVTLQNYGEHTTKGKFIDVSQISGVDYESISDVVLTLHNWTFPDEELSSTHYNDNGIYKVIAVNDNTLTLQALDKSGVAYSVTPNWTKFAGGLRTCTDCVVALMDFEGSASKSNVAGYYRACPLGATAQYYEVDFDFPNGLYRMDDQGDYKSRTATILLEYRIAGSTDEPTQIRKVYSRASGDEFAETISIDVGNNNHAYEFRVTNESEYTTDSQIMQTFVWNGLKCQIADTERYDGVTMIALTVRGSQSLSELTNNQISTMWERRLAPLKDVATTIEVEREVEGFNSYKLTPVDIRKAILASKCYPVEWDEDTAKLDHAYVDEYIDASDSSGYIHIHYTPEQSTVEQTYTKPYDSYSYHPMILVSDELNGFNYPTREYTVEFQIRNMYISGSFASYHAIYFLFSMDRFTREKTMSWVDNRQCYGYAIRFLARRIALVRMKGSHNAPSSWTVIKEWVSDYQSYPYTAKITIHKTPGYINVKDNSAYDDADRDFTLTADDDPNIPNALGTYCGFAAGGFGANSWVIDFKDFIFSIPTKLKVKTIEKVNPATLSVDREANRALAPAIRYICDNSKFTADMYNSDNLLKYDRLWRNNGDKFDFRFDTSTTVLEAIQQIAQVGYAEPITIGNQINIVHKEKDAPIAQMFTPANMTGDPKITYSFRTPDDTDEIDCKFTSASTWKSEEIYIQIDDDNKGIMRTQRNSANDEQCELLAVTDAQRAYKLGLRRLRDVLFSRTQIEFQTELDALNCQYGDLIAVALPQDLSVYSGRITGYDSQTGLITLSEHVSDDELGAGVLYVRRPNGTAQQLTVLYNDDGTVVTTVPLDFEPDLSTPDTMPLYAFGRVARYWVTSIKTSGNGTKCTVTGTVYDERVFAE